MIKLQIVTLFTQAKDFEKALEGLNEIESRITESTNIGVRSQFYRTQAELDKARGDFDAFYYHALLYLSTSGTTEDPTLAFDLCMAALFSSKVCSFGELAAHPILKSLSGEDKWLADLILLLDSGNPSANDVFHKEFIPLIKESPLFSPYLMTIQRKLNLSIFLQMIA